jgi:acetolactate synthase-1/2/3 large subunit
MNGAESLVRTLLACGVDTCFANPGTSEMHFVAALDKAPGMRCVLGLAETVVTGCADGYARMTGKAAATLLHCGPGFANGIANLHNARRAERAQPQGTRARRLASRKKSRSARVTGVLPT